MSAAAPVGVFDSGLGGLSVAREIRRLLPSEPLVYFADTARCPYGGRPLEEIRLLSREAARQLQARGAKAIVVACNTASGAALETLRAELSIPIIGLEPAVKPAAERSRAGSVGVMATTATLKTERFQRLLDSYANGIRVVPQACPGLVELVEEGQVAGEGVRAKLEPLIAPLRAAAVDVVVLGCTHYPFLRAEIERALGPGVLVLDSGEAVARQVERVLADEGLLAPREGDGGMLRLLTTGSAAEVAPVAERLWGGAVEVLEVPPAPIPSEAAPEPPPRERATDR